MIIETPKGSRNKYSFDPELRFFSLKKVLPAGMTFPYVFLHRCIGMRGDLLVRAVYRRLFHIAGGRISLAACSSKH